MELGKSRLVIKKCRNRFVGGLVKKLIIINYDFELQELVELWSYDFGTLWPGGLWT